MMGKNVKKNKAMIFEPSETGHNLVLFTSKDGVVSIPAALDQSTVWLSQAQMSALFGKERSVVTKHIRNAFDEGEVDEKQVCANFAHTAEDGKTYQVVFYNLDVIISVGYRVKSQRGVEFRRWATGILRDYMLKGYALNKKRLKALGQVVSILKRAERQLDARQVLSVVERYTSALELLDAYDHQRVGRPKGRKAKAHLTYSECRKFVDAMRFGSESALFGREKDDSFKSSLGAIYQTFEGKDLYPSVEEKAANLLYFVVKNHSFTDGNKRIGAALFLYFLDKNKALLTQDGHKRLADHTLVALTILIAESKPVEREIMLNLVMTFLAENS
jgi:prophage maintenance system killer protein